MIHFQGKFKRGAIRGLSFEKFAQGRDIYVARSQKGSCFSADVVITRAISKLGKPDYNLFINNCQHFAHWCKAGRKRCGQVHNFMEKTGGILGGAIAGKVAAAALPLAVPRAVFYGVYLAAGYARRELGKICVNLFSDRPEYDNGGIPF